MAKWTKRILGAGVIAGAAYALWKVIDQRTRESTLEWTPQPMLSPPRPVPHVPEHAAAPMAASNGSAAAASTPPAPEPAGSATADAPWIDPVEGACPVSHPVKAKLASGIFHVPGGQMYERTVPDRCYADAAAAEADGLRASKR